MLTYVIKVIETLFAPALLLGFFYVCVSHESRSIPKNSEDSGSRSETGAEAWDGRLLFLRCLAAGAFLALVLAVLKTHTAFIRREFFNIGALACAVPAEIVFIIALWSGKGRRQAVWTKVLYVSASIAAAALAFYSLPDIFLYPVEFVPVGETFGTETLYKWAGYISGLILTAVATGAMIRGGTFLKASVWRGIAVTAATAILLVPQAAGIIQPLLARRIIPMKRWLFRLLLPVINNGNFFILALMAVSALYLVGIWVKTSPLGGPFANPARERSARARRRSTRRWIIVALAAFVIGALSLTVVKAGTQKTVTLSPPEPMEIVGDEILIPLENVNDGHLHRFVYTAHDGIEMRFIIIKKNAVSYGVGLDACDICGATGYYERNDQVICKLCDVVMNKSTIGFKGGCNPVPLAFSLREGRMVILTKDLDAESKRFK